MIYRPYDLVGYKGSSWLAIRDSIGVEPGPLMTVYWALQAQRGAQGPPGRDGGGGGGVGGVAGSGATGPAGPTGPTGSPGADGAPGLIPLGTWDIGMPYQPTDVVEYNGSAYVASMPNTGQQPDISPTDWDLLVAKGAPGPTGPAGPPGSGSGFPPLGVPVLDVLTHANLAPGAAVDLATIDVDTGKQGDLLRISYASSVACKWEVYTVVSGTPLLRLTRMTTGLMGGRAEGDWDTPGRTFISVVDVAGTEHFQVTVTNLDMDKLADVYAQVFWDEVTP